MIVKTRIVRHERDMMIVLPDAFVRELSLRDGDSVALRLTDAGLLIERSRHKRLVDRLATVRARESEIGSGR